MKICVAGSMQHAEKMAEACKELERRGHTPIPSQFLEAYLGDKTDEEREAIKLDHKYNHDAIREFWYPMRDGADAILVLNHDKHGIKNYIGGNAFLEMGFAYVLEMKIFLMNPAPDMPYYGTEIIAMQPVVIDGDWDKIK